MTDNITLTTGQTCGLTGLSLQTVQRYIRRYPMGFSEEARKRRKGRRFNGDDIKSLLLINHLLNSRQKNIIEKVLTGEAESPDLSLFEITDFMRMFNTITALKKQLEAFYLEVKREKESIDRLGTVVRNHSRALEVLRFDVSRLKISRTLREDDFDHPHPAVNAEYKKVRKNPIARWLDGED